MAELKVCQRGNISARRSYLTRRDEEDARCVELHSIYCATQKHECQNVIAVGEAAIFGYAIGRALDLECAHDRAVERDQIVA